MRVACILGWGWKRESKLQQQVKLVNSTGFLILESNWVWGSHCWAGTLWFWVFWSFGDAESKSATECKALFKIVQQYKQDVSFWTKYSSSRPTRVDNMFHNYIQVGLILKTMCSWKCWQKGILVMRTEGVPGLHTHWRERSMDGGKS